MDDPKKQNFLNKLKNFTFNKYKANSYQDTGFSDQDDFIADMALDEDELRSKIQHSHTSFQIQPTEPFDLESDNIELIEDKTISFSQDSHLNACYLWGSGKSSWKRPKNSKGIQYCIEKKYKETGMLYTDVLVCVHKMDYQHIRLSSKYTGRRYDDAKEEIELLKKWANEYFINKSKKNPYKPLIPGRSFHFDIRSYSYDFLKNSFLVVLKKNIFIVEPNENCPVIADITVNYNGNSIRKKYHKDKLCFYIGSDSFDDISVKKLPKNIQFVISYDHERFNLEYQIDTDESMYDVSDLYEQTERQKSLMGQEDGSKWFIEEEHHSDGFHATVLYQKIGDQTSHEFLTIDLVIRNSKKNDIRHDNVNSNIENNTHIEKNSHLNSTNQSANISNLTVYPKAPRRKMQHNGNMTKVISEPKKKKAYSRLTRTYRFLPYPVKNDTTYTAWLGSDFNWVRNEHVGATIKISWDLDKVALTPLVDNYLWCDQEWPKSETQYLNENFGKVTISQPEDSLHFTMNSHTRPIMTFQNGEKDMYHWACLDNDQHFIVPLRHEETFITIGRDQTCNINNSLIDSIDKALYYYQSDPKTNESIIEELNKIKQSYAFSNIMSSRYHALFDHVSGHIVNLSDIPIFIFEKDSDDKFIQKLEIQGLPKEKWCNKCIKAIELLDLQPANLINQYVRDRIRCENGFINCEICTPDRPTESVTNGQYIVVGNAMYLYEITM